ncbi:dihydrofolate reductase family protein [Microbacterium hatanonis]|uniref:Deaminase n=1 Tax=Microbacterium hatanonis TaxID=404366 RepID=A0A5C8I2X2_9MICO|nr:dihydrofolate reductase family protein [Microbacterium hatanonis]TXK13116.1 deaminase [Microbacterium hatanonis]
MATTYTWDVFSTLDGYGSYDPGPEGVDWGGYWSKQGPELLEWRARRFEKPQRMVYGATTFREVAGTFAAAADPNTLDEWNVRLSAMPATVASSTLQDTLGWPDATIEKGDATAIVSRLKETSPVPLRSQASLTMNWSLLAAGLIDRIEVTLFPVITGRTGTSPIYAGLKDYDLELLDNQTLDGRTIALTYRPSKPA